MCLRFCYVPLNSRVPVKYRCQPELTEEEEEELKERLVLLDDEQDQRIKEFGLKRIKPLFNSTKYGHPQYAQLNIDTHVKWPQNKDRNTRL